MNPNLYHVHIQLTESEVAEMRSDPRVKTVHANSQVQPQAAPPPASPTLMVQKDAPWNLDRLDQPALLLDGLYHYVSDGSNVNVYVLDTVQSGRFSSPCSALRSHLISSSVEAG